MKTNKSLKNRVNNDILADNEPFSISIGSIMGAEEKREDKDCADVNVKAVKSPPCKLSADEFSCKHASLQKEKAGRGGKTVTMVFLKPEQTAQQLENLAKTMRKALGCGSHVEDNKVILQGDIADRAAEWFAKNGIKTATGR